MKSFCVCRSQGLWIEEDVLDGLKSIQLEEWSPDAGSNQLKKGGGSITVGDDFSSNFLAVYPMQRLTKDGKTFTVKLKVEESAGHSTYVYHSSDMKTWSKISDASISDGTATFKASAGRVICTSINSWNFIRESHLHCRCLISC